jgi:hypothetical protein
MAGSQQKAAALADRFESAHREVLEVAHACSDAEWAVHCAGEGWSVGVVVDHIADANVLMEAALRGHVNGTPVPFSPEMVDAHNAEHATACSNRSRDETLAELEASVAVMVATIRSLSDDEVEVTLPFALQGGAPTRAAGVVERVTAHAGLHLANIRAALTA